MNMRNHFAVSTCPSELAMGIVIDGDDATTTSSNADHLEKHFG